jgi:nucleotide-binding universal stress UspA family protein
MTVVRLIRRLRDEFTSMPGLRLSEEQVQRLCDVDASTSASALRALVSAGLLRELDDGTFGRADIANGPNARPAAGEAQPPWRHILCLVDFEGGRHDALTAASQSALGYAASLGAAHRAKVTALHLTQVQPTGAHDHRTALRHIVRETQGHTGRQASAGAIDVHVAPGTSNDDVLRAAREIDADLIVLGRPEDATDRSRLREVLRDAPCHVLVIHPSGQAAVA